ncbi:MAG: Fic family protein [Verrucomicrobiota bacterium]
MFGGTNNIPSSVLAQTVEGSMADVKFAEFGEGVLGLSLNAIAGPGINTALKGLGGLGTKSAIVKTSEDIVVPTVDDIMGINKAAGGTTTLTGEVDTVIANMQYQSTVNGKAAVAIRDIAGRHMFNDGNKRTASAVAQKIIGSNGGSTSASQIRGVVNQVASGQLRSVDDISSALSK